MRCFIRLGLLLLSGFIEVRAPARDWPQFRGSQASGVDSTAVAPVHWDVKTGENARWSTPIPGLAHSSPILWSNRVYVTTAARPGKADLKVGLYGDIESAELGNVFVVAATPSFSVVATNALDETCMATPAISNGTLFYRTREHLVCIGRKSDTIEQR